VRAGASLATERRAWSDAPYQNNSMKTPRDILFVCHQAATPKLDAIRREVVDVAADVNRRKPVREFTFAATLAKAVAIPFRELIWPCRRIWTGLAAVWILIFIVNFSQRDGSQTMMAKSTTTPEIMMTFRDQQKWLNELLADRSPPMDADQPRIYSPKPRTETTELLTV
jgi:hypothetical protein